MKRTIFLGHICLIVLILFISLGCTSLSREKPIQASFYPQDSNGIIIRMIIRIF